MLFRSDENGSTIGIETRYANDNLFNDFIYNYKYDENGNMIVGYTEESLQLRIMYLFKYDENGKMVEMYSDTGDLISKFDENGNEIEHNECWPEKERNTKSVKKYDKKGNLIENCIYNYMGKSVGTKTYKRYDEKDNLIEESSHNQDDSLDSRISYKYDYDSRNNWIKKIELRNYKYGYDTHNNWVKTEFPNGLPVFITVREIDYWD